MSDEQVEATPEPKQPRQLMSPQTRNLIVGTALAVILLTITAWAGSVRTEKARRAALVSGVSALAASLKYPMLEANSMRTNAGRDRLRPIVIDIATSGGYSAVTITGPDGDVLATTKGDLTAEKLDKEALPVEGAKVSNMTGGLVVAAPIKLADNVLGHVFVEIEND